MYTTGLGWLMVVGLCLLAVPGHTMQGDWQPARQDDGVQVDTALVTGSKYLAFRAQTVIDAPMADVLAEVIDHERYPQWYYNCKSVDLVELHEDDSALVRVTIDSPFPLADRDAVNRVTVDRSEDEIWVHLQSQPRRLPEVKGAVRMRVANGAWHLQRTASGTRVTHYYQADPEARVPAWMVNRFVVDGPIHSLSQLRQRVEQGGRR